VAEAVAEYRKAIELNPKHASSHNNLGNALHAQGQVAEAIAEYRKALEFNPQLASAHNNIGRALRDQGQLDDAITEYRQALRLNPRLPQVHYNLANALKAQGKVTEAIGGLRAALALNPNFAEAHNNLGKALQDQGQLGEAVEEYRKAVAINPKLAAAHGNLARALKIQGKLDDAIDEYQKALALAPKDVPMHHNFGNALQEKGRLDEAVAEYQKAIDLNPKYPLAHGALGDVRLREGRFAEARASTRRCLDLLPERHPLRAEAARQLKQCERMLELEPKLAQVLTGQAQPAGAFERLEYAQLCARKQPHDSAAARFYAEAFAAEPKLANDLRGRHRYQASCAAVLAAPSQGQEAERTRLRGQALDWLRADLAAWGQLLGKEPDRTRAAVQQALRQWQQDPNLAGVRGNALAKLPEAERQSWRQLWGDVEQTLKKAADPDTRDVPRNRSREDLS
jgi:tetratricopeptide (TPR) repeat protein